LNGEKAMIRSNLQLPNTPDGWLDKDMSESDRPVVQIASTLDYDGARRQLTLTRSDGTIQEFPASNNPDSRSRGRWPNGTFDYERHTSHPEDAPDSAYGSHGNYIFSVPGRQDMGIHSGHVGHRDGLGRSGVDYPTFGCIRTTDEGTAAIRDAMRADDPVTSITVDNNH